MLNFKKITDYTEFVPSYMSWMSEISFATFFDSLLSLSDVFCSNNLYFIHPHFSKSLIICPTFLSRTQTYFFEIVCSAELKFGLRIALSFQVSKISLRYSWWHLCSHIADLPNILKVWNLIQKKQILFPYRNIILS